MEHGRAARRDSDGECREQRVEKTVRWDSEDEWRVFGGDCP